jgi:CubicO group peptidase (beta-lactamase class C family)
MHAIRRLLLAVSLALTAATAVAQDTARMEQVVQSYIQNNGFMGTVLVARGTDIVFNKAYGLANVELSVPNTPGTRFRLGSITKQFTAASILLLEEQGKLRLEDPIRKHMPDAPAAWDAITLYHLLTHTSGIPNFTAMKEYAALKGVNTPVEKTIATFRDTPLDFPPGEKMSYSNSGYLVLGWVIEKVSGSSYAAFVQERIFSPLGMKDSGYDSNTAIIPRRAAGYVPGQGGPSNAGYIHMSIPHAAGALYSSTEDLLRWEQALFGGKVVSPASLQKMTTPNKNDYALGLVVRSDNGRRVVSHGGGIDGFNTALSYYPDTRTTIAVLANINGPAPDRMAGQLGALAHGAAVVLASERKAIDLAPDALGKYVGVYMVRPGVELTITFDGKQLMTQLTGQPAFPLFAESPTRFFLKAVDATIDFTIDAGGAVSAATLLQGASKVVAPRRK